jgi:hypothetical protein
VIDRYGTQDNSGHQLLTVSRQSTDTIVLTRPFLIAFLIAQQPWLNSPLRADAKVYLTVP